MAANQTQETETNQDVSTTTNRVVTFDNDNLAKLALLSKTTGLDISEIVNLLIENPSPDSLSIFSSAIEEKSKRQIEALQSLLK